MAILIKGTDFAEGTPVTDVALDALVDAATFDTGAVDDVSTQLSGGAIIVKDGGITPAKLSTGKPTWDASGNVSIPGTLTIAANNQAIIFTPASGIAARITHGVDNILSFRAGPSGFKFVNNADDTVLATMSNAGALSVVGTCILGSAGSGNVGIGTSSFGTSGINVLSMANCAVPSTSPAGIGQLYVEAGALKFRGSSGTVTTVAPA